MTIIISILWFSLKKQSGGRGKFADIEFEIGPADLEWLTENKDKHLAKKFVLNNQENKNYIHKGTIQTTLQLGGSRVFCSLFTQGIEMGSLDYF